MKTISVPRPVKDVNGLLTALKKSQPPYDVLNVGTDGARTFVYLQDHEAKDPTQLVQNWTDPAELKLATANEKGPDGVSVAWCDGKAVHELVIEKVKSEDGETLAPGGETLCIIPSKMVHVSNYKPVLYGGRVRVSIGPLTEPAQFDVAVVDPAKKLGKKTVTLRFEPQPEKKPTAWSKFMGKMPWRKKKEVQEETPIWVDPAKPEPLPAPPVEGEGGAQVWKDRFAGAAPTEMPPIKED